MLQPSDEIKSRIDIVDLIREYMQIKPAGLNFRGLCPFHREKTPSFMVSPEKQIWHCFGCGKGGDAFAFIMAMENVEFVEALRILAPKAGVVLKREDKKITSLRNRLQDIIDLSRRYFHKILLDSPEAKLAREYLLKRGLDEDTIEEWQIGASPNSWDLTVNFLRKNGFNDNEIFSSGMCVKGTSKPGYYDRFRGRIMFPINDINGNTIAFTARVSPEREMEEKMGKYINSPQTLIYDKSKVLFGLDKAMPAIKKENAVIIVEGQMDVITAHQFGFKNTVASSGTALTADQIELLARRFTKNFLFALDFDSAGQLAIDRGGETVARVDYREIKAQDPQGKEKNYIDTSLSHNINVKIIAIPDAKDPDECIRKNLSGWQTAVKEAKPIMEYYFQKILAGKDLDNVDNKRQIAKEFLGKIVKLGDKIEQDYWLKNLSQKIDVEEAILRETLKLNFKKKKAMTEENNEHAAKPEGMENSSREDKLSELLLALMIKFPALLEYSINHFQSYFLNGDSLQALYRNSLFYYNNIISENTLIEAQNSQIFDFGSFKLWLSEQAASNDKSEVSLTDTLDKLAILGDGEFYDWEIEQAKNEAIKYISALKRHYLLGRMNELEKLIFKYENEKNEQAVKELMSEFKILSDELNENNKE